MSDDLGSVMSGDVVTADEGATLLELAEMMIDEEVGSVVITEHSQVIGIVTERDLVRAMADGLDLARARAFDVMTEHPLCADIDDRLPVVVSRMVEAGVLHVPVLMAGHLRGMLSARDLLVRRDVTRAEEPANP